MMLGENVVTRCDSVTSCADCVIIIMCHIAQTSLLSAVEIAFNVFLCFVCHHQRHQQADRSSCSPAPPNKPIPLHRSCWHVTLTRWKCYLPGGIDVPTQGLERVRVFPLSTHRCSVRRQLRHAARLGPTPLVTRYTHPLALTKSRDHVGATTVGQ